MFKKRMWLGIILSIIFLVFSVNGFTAYYKYTQESGTNFYVGTDDKADALEDTNEMRQIIDDLGNLLGHSKRDDLYPKNGIYGGYLGRLNYGLDASKPAAPVVNDMYLATDTVKIYRCFVAANWVQVYPGAGVTTFLELSDTPAAYDNGKYAKSTVDGVVWDDPTGAGDMTKAVYDTDTDNIVDKAETVDDGVGNSSTAADVKDAVTKKHTQNTDTALGIQTQDLNMGTHKIIGVVNPVEIQDVATKNYVDSNCDLSKDQSPQLANDLDLNDQNIRIDADLDIDHNYSGLIDSQPVGEAVVFGDLLYPDWTAGEWLKADADLAAKMPGLRIALESKTDGQTCLMLVKGYIRDDSAFEFTASMVYTSVTPGTMSSTAPTETGDQLQRVGVAKSADILFFDPSIDVGEIKP